MMRKFTRFASTTTGGMVVGFMLTAAIAQNPEPTTFVDVPAPQLTGWNNINALTVDPQRPDGRTYIYPDEATKAADTEGDGTGSVAFIHWDLDDGSGRAPGLQAVTDDFAFPTHNCIMASGEREFEEGIITPKTCSDPRGSSKRIFLEINEADTPIDIVFNTGSKDIRYKGVQDPEVVGNDDALSDFRDTYGIGRIYRVIQKFINDTDERLVAIRVEVGTGVGDDFQPLPFSDGVAFELRPLVDREFFVGNTGAGDREVWNAERFAHFSPKMFDTGGRPRFDPGFFDDQAAGLFPPQAFQTTVAEGTKTQFIDSGDDVNAFGHYGALTPNYFDIPANQGSGADPAIPGIVFGYLMPEDIAPTVIERHDDGDPETEGDDIMAWWDGSDWRYGLDDNFAVVPDSQLQQWAALLLGLNLPGVADPARYGSGESDDLSGVNMDTYLYLDENLLEAGDNPYFNNGLPTHETITLRYRAISVSSLGTVPGTGDPEWTQAEQEAPPLSSYMPETGVPVAINDVATTMRDENVNIDVLANDLLDGAPIDPNDAAVAVADDPENGSAVEQPDQSVTYTPNTGFTGQDTFTYTVEVDGEVSNVATVKVTVVAPPDPDVPVARNDSATTTGTEPVVIDILANDTVGPLEEPVDPAQATVTLGAQPALGSVDVNPDNRVTYTANTEPDLPQVDYFTYTVTVDGQESNSALVIVRVDPPVVVPIVPLAVDDTATTSGNTPVIIDVLANDTYDGVEVPSSATVQIFSTPDHGTVAVNPDQTVTYTATKASFSGEDTFTYTVNVDGQVSDPATVTVSVELQRSSSSNTFRKLGCTVGSGGGGFDPLLPFLVLFALGYIILRRPARPTR